MESLLGRSIIAGLAGQGLGLASSTISQLMVPIPIWLKS